MPIDDARIHEAPDGPRPADFRAIEPHGIERPRRGWRLDLNSPGDFEWNIVRLPIADLPSELEKVKIVHLTDLHVKKPWRPAYDRLLARLESARPDLILITGDFVDSKRNPAPALPALYRLLAPMQAPLGCFGILGNHDRADVARLLAPTPVTILTGQRTIRLPGGAGLDLVGLPGTLRKHLKPSFVKSIPPRSSVPNSVRIVLSHYPDHILRTRSLQPDVFLAGHTHGGQICLPGGIPIIRHDSLPRRLCTGVHEVAGAWLVVGRGLGAGFPPCRLFCPPEVLEIHLVRASIGAR